VTRVLIADDHRLVREGLKKILTETPDIVVVAEASTGDEVLEKICTQDCDVILLDITMPGKSGLDVLSELHKANKQVKVLVLSMHPEEQYAVRALRLGAAGYLTKKSASEELIAAVQNVSAGKKYITRALAQSMASVMAGDSKKNPDESLSRREHQVFRLIAQGESIKEIAAHLSLSIKTVSTYRSRVLKKTGMKNSAALIYYAVINGMVEIE
jgi:two-component system, NarL family, invasion response regulator UvrY